MIGTLFVLAQIVWVIVHLAVIAENAGGWTPTKRDREANRFIDIFFTLAAIDALWLLVWWFLRGLPN